MKTLTARLIVIAVIIMVLLNGGLLILLWNSQAAPNKRELPSIEEINNFIIVEMGYDNQTADAFIKIAETHRSNQHKFQGKYRELKRELNMSMLEQDDERVNIILDDLAAIVKKKELELYRFFSEVMKISSPEQQRSFGRIFREATGAPEYERIPMDRDNTRPPHPPKH
ncbi:hypothetical protein [Ekhidna sp.]